MPMKKSNKIGCKIKKDIRKIEPKKMHIWSPK